MHEALWGVSVRKIAHIVHALLKLIRWWRVMKRLPIRVHDVDPFGGCAESARRVKFVERLVRNLAVDPENEVCC
jgi:hypothetical protein